MGTGDGFRGGVVQIVDLNNKKSNLTVLKSFPEIAKRFKVCKAKHIHVPYISYFRGLYEAHYQPAVPPSALFFGHFKKLKLH